MSLVPKISNDSKEATWKMNRQNERKAKLLDSENDPEVRKTKSNSIPGKIKEDFFYRCILQMEYEYTKLNTLRIQKVDNPSAFPLVDGLKLLDLNNAMSKKFYNYETMEAIRSAINVIIDTKLLDDDQTIREKIHKFFKNSLKFGANSANGVAMKSSIYTKTNIDFKGFGVVVLKVPKNPAGSSEMIHEIIVGLLGLNKLRKKCPNFSYVFDSFSCGEPIVGKDKKIIEMCIDGAQDVSYAIYENVREPSAFREINNESDLILCYLQVLYALKIANKDCGFTHYDLHFENVLTTPFSKSEFYIPYVLDDKTVYLKTNGKIAMMIDYGMSVISVPEDDSDNTLGVNSVGILDYDGFFEKHNMYSDKPNYMNDPYKLICFMLSDAYKHDNKTMLPILQQIVGYFYGVDSITDEDVQIILEYQGNDNYNIHPNVIAENNWDMDDLINHCVKIANTFIDNVVLHEQPENTLGFGNFGEGYASFSTEISSISSNEIGVVSAFELYENKKDNTEIYPEMLSNFKATYEKTLAKEIEDTKILRSYVAPTMTFTLMKNAKDINLHYNTFYDNIVKIIELIETVAELAEDIKYISLCKDIIPNVFDEFYSTLKTKHDKLSVLAAKHIRPIKSDAEFLEKISKNEHDGSDISELSKLYKNATSVIERNAM